MAIYSATTEGEEALASGTAETVVQLRGAATTKAKIIAFGISFDGVAATDAPVVVRMIRQTTDGTATGATEVKWDPDDPAAACTAFHSFTAEPTAGEVLMTWNVHPQTGIDQQFPLGREPRLSAATTSRIAIEANAPAGVNVVAYLVWEE